MSIAQHLPLADHIIILDEEGKLAEQGTWADLRAEAGYISKVLLKQKENEGGEDKARRRAEVRDKTQTPQQPPNSNMQDIARKTGDATLYSMLQPCWRRMSEKNAKGYN
jgi:ATP-binding cassette, subfamily C (CFTR/MRP), member 1